MFKSKGEKKCDDRIIHGQVVTHWVMERECDGLIAVNVDYQMKTNTVEHVVKEEL
ncbi:MAG: PTS sugar transporter subunit IIB [Lachnospiraceae bacterium]